MIIRPRPHWLHLLFVRRGSLVRQILTQQLFIFILACGVVYWHGELLHWKITLNAAPFSLMGVALAIFLGFRINASYDRYWEARKWWGAVLVDARNAARQVLTLPKQPVDARQFVLGLIAFATTMRNQLRGMPRQTGTETLLPSALQQMIGEARYAPVLVLKWLGEQLSEMRAQGALPPELSRDLERSLNNLSAALGACERIAGTPLPFTYSVILHRSAYVYCMMLPFGLVDSIGLMTPLVVAFVSYTFFSLEALSEEIEEPFGLAPNDLALDAMVAGINISLREMLGEPAIAPPRPDRNYQLT